MTSPTIDIEALKARAIGGGFVAVCQHPDLSESLPTDSFDRVCVLDRAAPQDCDQSAIEMGGAVKTKTDCPFWLPMQQAKPEGLSAEEALSLIARTEAAEWEVERLTSERDANAWFHEFQRKTTEFNKAEIRIAELVAQRDGLVEALAQATRFELPNGMRIEQRKQIHGEPLWAVTDGAFVLNRSGEWVYEPLPSSRTDEFIAATRFTLAEARSAALSTIKAGGGE